MKPAYAFSMVLAIVVSALYLPVHAQNDTDTIPYPLNDRPGDPYTYPNRNPFDLPDTGYINRNIVYDPVTGQYYIIEKVGDRYFRVPTSFTMKEFLELQGRRDEIDYFRQRADMLSRLNRRNYRPPFGFNPDWMNRITGSGKFDVNPNGYVDIAAGYQGQNIKNPTLPERARRTGGLDFNMNAQLQADAIIGDKFRLPISYNTLANFDFENQLKLNYMGKSDEMLKFLEAGNINYPARGTLIPGAQSLFGVKTQLQFGKIFVTSVLANQRSQRQSLGLQGGAASQIFNIRADEYEENRHFLLAQYFRNNFNNAMSQIPLVKSNVQILRLEVWVTNRTGATTDTRDIIAFMDLGERVPFSPLLTGTGDSLPKNGANDLYSILLANPNYRNSTMVQSLLTAAGFQPVQDFEKTFARKLQPGDYYFNPQIGFLSLNQQLQPDEVLGVAYQYSYNGKIFQVGEFSQDVPPDSTGNTQKALFLKLLKATSQRTNLPIWDLMMKNIYAVGWGQLERQDFQLHVVYEEPSLGEKRYLPVESVLPQYQGAPLLGLLNLDRLNNQNDPQPDGQFDYLENLTVISSQSRIIFPVLEPFGRDLEYVYPNQDSARKYLFYPLYDTIKAIAQTYANLNRFKLVGRSKSSGSGDYQLGFNIPRGSVSVTAGGRLLVENVDYEINYDLGTLKIINPAIIQAGLPVNVQFENNAMFGLQQRNYMGLRIDYLANRNLSMGATVVRLGERPFFTKQGYGEDPIRNTMYGFDFDYRNDVPRVTKWLDKLPFYSTRAPSSITAYGEAAYLQPGHARQINADRNDKGGVIYIDDFEGTRSSIDLRFPLNSWTMASVPQKSPSGITGQGPILFPEADLHDNIESGFNRAKLAWYNIEPVLQERRNPNNPLKDNLDELSKPETRQVLQSEIFPQRTQDIGQGILTTFDLAFRPRERGPYNFRTSNLGPNGALLNPKGSWGGIMRNIDQTDFETSNIEFIEFWVKDPFINNPNQGGELYINIGNISEDVLRDGKRLYENGLPTPTQPNIPVDETNWGVVPRNPIQVTNAFSNDPGDRPFQDVGFDGLVDSAERRKFEPYLLQLAALYGTGSAIYQNAFQDPSGDNFRGYRDYDVNTGILDRYRHINNPHGNSPVAGNNDQFVNAFTLYPDQEELNRDNTLNEVEEYFQYRVELRPGMNTGNNKYITDVREVQVHLANGGYRDEKWYLFRVPISDYQAKVGNIPDFKSIRFIRMFLTNFEDEVVLRFGKLELVRNQWRKFNYEVDSSGLYKPLPAVDPVTVNVLAVNLEENDTRYPIPYMIPPGILRQQQISNNNVQLLLNEQSLSLRLQQLFKRDARGVFKTMNLDLRQYGRLAMFIHAESLNIPGNDIPDGHLEAVVRLGNDFVSNYYEIRIPLKTTPWFTTDSLGIWPEQNNLDFELNILTQLKTRRNKQGVAPSQYYSEVFPDGKKFAIIGNPNLGEVRGMFLGVENVKSEVVSTEIWFNELRLSRLNEDGGWAALGRVDLRLADLGNLSVSGSYRSIGFGTLEQKVNERSREDFTQFDISTSLDLGKLLPGKAAVQIPVYAGISTTTSTPQYDPYDLDLELKEKLKEADGKDADSIRRDAIEQTTIKTLTFTNVKKNASPDRKPQPWDISNVDLNYSFTHEETTTPLIEYNDIRRTRAAIGYNYQVQPAFVEPLKNIIKTKSPWFALIRDVNFNYRPSMISVKADVFRQFGALRSRNVGTSFKLPEFYDKYFYFDRYYALRWDLTRSLMLDFNAVNNARIDEPFGRIDTDEKKDSVRSNFFKGGRNTHYHQQITLSYTLPTSKFPLLDWTNIRASYTATYDWIAASLLTRELGNTLLNGQNRNMTADLDFERLYNKWKFLRNVYTDAPQQPRTNPRDTARKQQAAPPGHIPAVPKFFARMATSLKRIGIQYTEDLGTLLPGYLDSTKFLGMNLRSSNPGWRYTLGYQPDTAAINDFGNRGLLSRDSLFNALIQQRYNQRISISAMIMPVRDLNIDLRVERTYDKQYSELYKDTTGNSGLNRFNPYATGSFSMSYISYQTLFEKFDPNEISSTFRQFEANRQILSARLKGENPYSAGAGQTPDGYYEGYGRYAQDVLIPAFLAAYTNKDPLSVGLVKNANPNLRSNPFSRLIPRPNWTITYNGLTRMKGMQKIFTNFTVRHGYNSTLSMNSFTTALLFQDPFRVGYPSFQDTLTGNYIPYFLVPNITISEQFSPLVGVDATFTNQLTARFEYRKTRQLALSLVDYQLAESRSTEYTVGMDWRRKGIPLLQNITIRGQKLNSDVTLRMDFSLRDDATANSKLDQNTAFGTAGQKVIRISPSIDYVVNNRVNLKFYFEQNRVIPKIATTAPITSTRAGLQVRIALAQ